MKPNNFTHMDVIYTQKSRCRLHPSPPPGLCPGEAEDARQDFVQAGDTRFADTRFADTRFADERPGGRGKADDKVKAVRMPGRPSVWTSICVCVHNVDADDSVVRFAFDYVKAARVQKSGCLHIREAVWTALPGRSSVWTFDKVDVLAVVPGGKVDVPGGCR